MYPIFKLVAINKTKNYSDEFQEKFGRIYDVYLYDETTFTNCCEITPSYELYYLSSVGETEYAHSEEGELELMDSNIWQKPIEYMHCSSVHTWRSIVVFDLNEIDCQFRNSYKAYLEDIECENVDKGKAWSNFMDYIMDYLKGNNMITKKLFPDDFNY